MIEGIIIVGITGVLGLLGWTLKQNSSANGFLGRMDERDRVHAIEIDKLRIRAHSHGNSLQVQEGRITNLELNAYTSNESTNRRNKSA